MNETTIEQAMKMKKQMEEAIKQAIETFTESTGLMVTRCSIENYDITPIGGWRGYGYEVSSRIEL